MSISTKYPDSVLIFPWFKAEEQSKLPYIIYPNWRKCQRPELQENASAARRKHAERAAFIDHTSILIDFDVLQYLKSITTPTLVVMDMQSYGVDTIETVVATLTQVYWCGRPGESIPRLDYTPAGGDQKPTYMWGPLLLCIAPVKLSAQGIAPQIFETTEERPRREDSNLLRILEEHGVPKVA